MPYEAVKGGNGTKHGAGDSNEANLMQTLPVLNGLGEEDGQDDGVSLPPDLVPGQVPDLACRGRVWREHITRAQHCQEQDQGGVLQDLEGGELDGRRISRRASAEEIDEDLSCDRLAPPGRAGEPPGRASDDSEQGAVFRRTGDPETSPCSVHSQC